MIEDRYSITAYEVKLSLREKGINGIKLEDLEDRKSYLGEPISIYSIFKRDNRLYHTKNVFFEIIDIESSYFCNFLEDKLKVKYGYQAGIDFSVEDGIDSHMFSKNSKIIKPFNIYFYIKNSKMYFVAFRNGQYSCKTAVEKRFKDSLDGTNVLVSFIPVGNEQFIKDHFSNCQVSSIQYDTFYKIDDGDLVNEPKVEKETCSNISINMTSPKNQKKYNLRKFGDILFGKTKEEIITKASSQADLDENVSIDSDSFKVEISINKSKRIINFNKLESLLFDIDITNLIKLDEEKNPIEESVLEIVRNYMDGILNNDQ